MTQKRNLVKILQKIHLRRQHERRVIKRLKVFYLKSKNVSQTPSSSSENPKIYHLEEFSSQKLSVEQTLEDRSRLKLPYRSIISWPAEKKSCLSHDQMCLHNCGSQSSVILKLMKKLVKSASPLSKANLLIPHMRVFKIGTLDKCEQKYWIGWFLPVSISF